MEIKCSCCGKMSSIGVMHKNDKKNRAICYECLKFAPIHYGFMSMDELIDYIKKRKLIKWKS